jgi:hypothetical protein
MKPTGRLLPLICVLIASVVLPAGAQANFVVSSNRSAEAHLAGTHGYRLTISAADGSISVTASKGYASVDYFLTGASLDGNRIDARLPGVGRVSLRFHEQARGHQPQPAYCHGPPPVVRHGVFVGYVHIEGERGYTHAESRHVRGKIVQSFRSACHLPFRGRRPGKPALKELEALAPRGRGVLAFTAISLPLFEKVAPLVFRASLSRLRGKMLISNSAFLVSKKTGALTFATPPRSATVAPPQPFTGSAVFQQESSKDFSWTGDLAVDLPGIGEVSLAGPEFESGLCVGHQCRGVLDLSGAAIAVAQGSGSHSQPLALARLSSLR